MRWRRCSAPTRHGKAWSAAARWPAPWARRCILFTPFQAWQAGALALVVVVAGFFGGLVLSAMKRSLGIKDWGRSIPGHGGVLDRLDSVAFSAPIFFHLVRFWFAN